jgi:hypothetical protein
MARVASSAISSPSRSITWRRRGPVWVSAFRIYEPPFTHINEQGVEGVFQGPDVDDLMRILNEVRERAAA